MDSHPLHASSLAREHPALGDQFNVETECVDIEDYSKNHNSHLQSLGVGPVLEREAEDSGPLSIYRSKVDSRRRDDTSLVNMKLQIRKDIELPVLRPFETPASLSLAVQPKMMPPLQLSDAGSIHKEHRASHNGREEVVSSDASGENNGEVSVGALKNVAKRGSPVNCCSPTCTVRDHVICCQCCNPS